MLSSFAVYFILLLFVRTESFQKIVHCVKFVPEHIKSRISGKSKISEKSKVTNYHDNIKTLDEVDNNDEMQGTNIHQNDNKALVVNNLTKTYGPKTVVENLKLRLNKNKCFGLLGVNGAGKSTTFRILTKALFFDKGEVTLDKVPITRDNVSLIITLEN